MSQLDMLNDQAANAHPWMIEVVVCLEPYGSPGSDCRSGGRRSCVGFVAPDELASDICDL